MTTPYQMTVNNAAKHIRNNPADSPDCINIFGFSSVMSVLFCKDKTEIIDDILSAHIVIDEEVKKELSLKMEKWVDKPE
jgi:hypothetical protein